MSRPALILAKAALAAAAVFFASGQSAFAQHRGGGGGRGGTVHSGTVHGGTVHSGGYHNGGYHNNGWGWGLGLALGYGLGSWGYYPNYGYYGPDYGYDYYAQPYYAVPVMPDPSQISLYPPPVNSENTALIDVRIPPDAELWFDGSPTTQRGPARTFTTPSLDPGRTFTYELRATWMANGQQVTQTRAVQVGAGKRSLVDFTSNGSNPK
jgi:uncharacterized protein (TIGR03000 family)